MILFSQITCNLSSERIESQDLDSSSDEQESFYSATEATETSATEVTEASATEATETQVNEMTDEDTNKAPETTSSSSISSCSRQKHGKEIVVGLS